MADKKNKNVTVDIGGWFQRQVDKYNEAARKRAVERNRINLSKKKAVAGFETYKPTDTSKGMFSTYKDKIANRGALKVTPGNIGGTVYKAPEVPNILKGIGGEKLGGTDLSTTPNVPNNPDLKKGTGKGNAYYPSTEKYKDKQRKEAARKARDIKQPRRVHEATRMAKELLKRPTK